jgi:uncharacterized DUF497 family protein
MNRTVRYELLGTVFEWDAAKAASNALKHGIPFESACEVFIDPFLRIIDDDISDELRYAAIGYSKARQLLYVVHVERHDEITRIISARKATASERGIYEDF